MRRDRLPYEVVSEIVQFIDDRLNEPELKTRFPNKLLREDVLDLLDMDCTVIYYPLENESNNGFHITGIPDRNGKEKHFVYINTSQTIDKQIFTAAHELGHVWEVDSHIMRKLNEAECTYNSEEIINRFAAELLMPKDQFLSVFYDERKKYILEDGTTTLLNFLKIIAALMYHFFVPQKAVIFRLFELGVIKEQALALFLGEGYLPEENITAIINEIMRENGHIKFLQPSQKRWIQGLAELLDLAEENSTVRTEKIENMRSTFKMPKATDKSTLLDEMVDVSSAEGDG